MNSPGTPAWQAYAAGPIDAEDSRALAGLATIYDAIDPVPAGLVDRLQFAITLDAFNAEVAELQAESGRELATARGEASAVKTLTFTSDSLTTMVTISSDGPDRVRIDGWTAPGAGVLVELRQGGVVHKATADDDGRFVFSDIEHGLTRFLVRGLASASLTPVITPAVEL